MKLAIKKIEQHAEGRFYVTLWFDLNGEDVRTKLTKDHIQNLMQKGKIPPKLAVGMVLNVCERAGKLGQKLYYVYGYESNKPL